MSIYVIISILFAIAFIGITFFTKEKYSGVINKNKLVLVRNGVYTINKKYGNIIQLSGLPKNNHVYINIYREGKNSLLFRYKSDENGVLNFGGVYLFPNGCINGNIELMVLQNDTDKVMNYRGDIIASYDNNEECKGELYYTMKTYEGDIDVYINNGDIQLT